MSNFDSVFYFDESGEKGYLDTRPEADHICIVAGFLASSENIDRINTNLDEIFSKIQDVDEAKRHATEVFKNGKNQTVREEFFEYFQSEDIHIVYNAEFLINVYDKRQPMLELEKKAKESRTNKDIRISGENREFKRTVLVDAMEGLFLYLDRTASELKFQNVQMISDNMDKRIFQAEQEELEYLDCGNNYKENISAYDLKTQTKLTVTMISQVFGIDVSVHNISEIAFETEVSNMGFAADIIANSLNFFIREGLKNTELQENIIQEVNLRHKEIIADFPLASKVRRLEGSRFVHLYGNDKC